MTTLADTYRAKYQPVADNYASQFGIPKDILSAVISKESSWNPYAIGSAGEIGFGQLKTGTAGDLKVNPWNPVENIQGTAAYLKQQYTKFGNWTDALGAYNQGAGNYNNANGQSYASAILSSVGMPATDPDGIPVGTVDTTTTTEGGGFFSKALDFMKGYTFGIAGVLIGAALIAFGLYAMVMSVSPQKVIKNAIG